MQRFTIAERLLAVALLPALALTARYLFGPTEQPLWLVFAVAVSLATPVLALLVAHSITAPTRRAAQAVSGLAAGGSREIAPARMARAEIVRLSAAIDDLLARTMARKRAESENTRLDEAERAARRANL